MESVDGDGFGVCDADHVAFDVGDRDGNRADDVEGVAEATSEESFVGGWMGGQKRTGNDGDSVVWFEKTNLFIKAESQMLTSRVRGRQVLANVSEMREAWLESGSYAFVKLFRLA